MKKINDTTAPQPSNVMAMIEKPWSWRDKLRVRLFPVHQCNTPKAPESHKDVLVNEIVTSFGWGDRIRVLVSGKVRVVCKTVTEHKVGKCIGASVAYPLPPKFMEP